MIPGLRVVACPSAANALRRPLVQAVTDTELSAGLGNQERIQMPTYEYKCLDCGKTFEVVQRMTDSHLTECRFCKGAVKRLIGTGAGVIFKGSGFYCTDYRSDGYRKESRKEAGNTAGSSTSDSGSETKKSDSASATAKPASATADTGSKSSK
jgi:putative FmdB family regulatory protein